MGEDARLTELERVVSNLVRDLVQLRQEVAALRGSYAGHTHTENQAPTYAQGATTGGPSDPGPVIVGVYSDGV